MEECFICRVNPVF